MSRERDHVHTTRSEHTSGTNDQKERGVRTRSRHRAAELGISSDHVGRFRNIDRRESPNVEDSRRPRGAANLYHLLQLEPNCLTQETRASIHLACSQQDLERLNIPNIPMLKKSKRQSSPFAGVSKRERCVN
jgi:hypothetical protein